MQQCRLMRRRGATWNWITQSLSGSKTGIACYALDRSHGYDGCGRTRLMETTDAQRAINAKLEVIERTAGRDFGVWMTDTRTCVRKRSAMILRRGRRYGASIVAYCHWIGRGGPRDMQCQSPEVWPAGGELAQCLNLYSCARL